MNKSRCCNAEIVTTHGCDSDLGHRGECDCEKQGRQITYWAECSKCKKPCSFYPAPARVSYENATHKEKQELIREVVKEANQDQRDTFYKR